MSERRLLPEAAYDFWALDGRDGEEGKPRNTLAEARADKKAWPVRFPWQRCSITVEWAVNERKVLKLLTAPRPRGITWKQIEALLRQGAKGAAELDKTLKRVFEPPPPGTRFG